MFICTSKMLFDAFFPMKNIAIVIVLALSFGSLASAQATYEKTYSGSDIDFNRALCFIDDWKGDSTGEILYWGASATRPCCLLAIKIDMYGDTVSYENIDFSKFEDSLQIRAFNSARAWRDVNNSLYIITTTLGDICAGNSQLNHLLWMKVDGFKKKVEFSSLFLGSIRKNFDVAERDNDFNIYTTMRDRSYTKFIKISPRGEFLWVDTISNLGPQEHVTTAIAYDQSNNNIIFSGYVKDDAPYGTRERNEGDSLFLRIHPVGTNQFSMHYKAQWPNKKITPMDVTVFDGIIWVCGRINRKINVSNGVYDDRYFANFSTSGVFLVDTILPQPNGETNWGKADILFSDINDGKRLGFAMSMTGGCAVGQLDPNLNLLWETSSQAHKTLLTVAVKSIGTTVTALRNQGFGVYDWGIIRKRQGGYALYNPELPLTSQTQSLLLYPNPTEQGRGAMLQLDATSANDNAITSYNITDLIGRELTSNSSGLLSGGLHNQTIGHNLPAGVYFVNVQLRSGRSEVAKLVVN